MSKIKLIVGLANTGAEYIATRHNAGAWYLDLLVERYNQSLKEKAKFFGYTARINPSGKEDIYLLVPTTFINLSGKAVSAVATFFRITPEEILVAHDDLDLLPGIAKFKQGGGSGGHNGLKDIINKLGNNNFHRLRIGIGHPGNRNKVTEFVLGKPSASEQKRIKDAIAEAVYCTEVWLKEARLKAINRLHSFKAS
ncbi:aminoacyl-tRNA hydrolase [Pantoea sp. Nvir]|uniref:aminoacyl-tRNA hydrolase n=1 Tax=Pantoea sp. Nvir TaxID=2576760 RepID=UPI001357CC04|nr:aminoacyl-tRNA hydrolase [Pantoea sp. Nvir]MXP66231.1 aminoacyl-tRNA hydrolase [Pantoea sp. Nvir]CAJ0991637.1 Peptidyl-tRNA hydrolase [Pantoea sp. Nvir]